MLPIQAMGEDGFHESRFARISPQAPGLGRECGPGSTGPVRDQGFPRLVRWTDPAHAAGSLEFLRRPPGAAEDVELGRVPRPAERGRDGRHSLRHEVEQARHGLAGGVRRHSAGPGRSRRPVRDGPLRWGLHDQRAGGRPHRRQGVGGLRLRRPAAGARAWRPGAAARPAPVLLEERQVGPQPRADGHQRPRLLGELRLPHLRRPMAGTALRGRLTWQVAKVLAVAVETPSVRTITLDVPNWPGHQAGQHVDIRLTDEDDYVAERSYSIASAPGEPVALTVERLDDGEVSPYLTDELRAGDDLELRGPIGGYFVWEPGDGGPLLLLAGGSGVVPLRSILRHRERTGSTVPVRLLYSSRTLDDVIYRTELDQPARGVEVIHTLTRHQPPGWTGYARRADMALLAEVAWPAAEMALAYVWGPTTFGETA